MLVNCPECGHSVSSMAQFCPSCGLPNNFIVKEDNALNKASAKRKQTSKRKMRLPNGFGSIRYLGKQRRKPYAAYPAVREYKDNGTQVLPPAIGYFETYNEAYTALALYNNKPYDLTKNKLTFEEVYNLFMDSKFKDASKYSKNAKRVYATAFNWCGSIKNIEFEKLKLSDLQRVVDGCDRGTATLKNILVLFKQMYAFALQNDITDKDYSQFVKINKANDIESGVPLSEKELRTIWENRDIFEFQIAAILCYSGWRINELFTCEIDIENKVMIGGSKTAAGKNRTVPIHEGIYELVKEFKEQQLYTPGTYRRKLSEKLELFGMCYAPNGERRTPHDFRHTFSWLCDKYSVDKLSKHKIMGHSYSGLDVEDSVYGHRTTEELRKAINQIEIIGNEKEQA